MQKKLFALAVLWLCTAVPGFGQPAANPPQNPQSDPDRVPLKGIEFLLTGGVVYGMYEVWRKRNRGNVQ